MGKIEVAVDLPDDMRDTGAAPRGIALVAHPHPLFGGTMDNKVAQTLARTLVQLVTRRIAAIFAASARRRASMTTASASRDDLLALLDHMRAQPGLAGLPLVLAGFSVRDVRAVARREAPARSGRDRRADGVRRHGGQQMERGAVPDNTLVIHGETDETVPITSVYDWARPQELPVVVIPGAEHFLHRKLHVLKRIVVDAWR